MTREEIETFIREIIDNDGTWVNEYSADEHTIQTIANRWEEDVQENRDASYQEGIHVGQESV